MPWMTAPFINVVKMYDDAGSGNIGWFLWWLLLSFIIFEIIDFYELIETCTCTYTPSLK